MNGMNSADQQGNAITVTIEVGKVQAEGAKEKGDCVLCFDLSNLVIKC